MGGGTVARALLRTPYSGAGDQLARGGEGGVAFERRRGNEPAAPRSRAPGRPRRLFRRTVPPRQGGGGTRARGGRSPHPTRRAGRWRVRCVHRGGINRGGGLFSPACCTDPGGRARGNPSAPEWVLVLGKIRSCMHARARCIAGRQHVGWLRAELESGSRDEGISLGRRAYALHACTPAEGSGHWRTVTGIWAKGHMGIGEMDTGCDGGRGHGHAAHRYDRARAPKAGGAAVGGRGVGCSTAGVPRRRRGGTRRACGTNRESSAVVAYVVCNQTEGRLLPCALRRRLNTTHITCLEISSLRV